MASYKDLLRQAIADAQANKSQSWSSMPWDTVPGGNSQYTGNFTYEPVAQWTATNGGGEAPPTMEEYQRSIAMGYGDASNLPYVPTLVTGPDGTQYVRYAANKDEGGDWIGPILGPGLAAAVGGMGLADILGAGAALGGSGTGVGAGAIESAVGIPELGLVANPATANAAIAGGIPAGMLSGGPGALTLADVAGNAAPSNFGNPEIDNLIQQTGSNLNAPSVPSNFGNPEIDNLIPQTGTSPSLPNLPPTPPTSNPGNFGNPEADNLVPQTGSNLTGGAPQTLAQWLSQATGLPPAALQALGLLGSTALGVYGSNQQADALTNIANQARADRQPFLNKSLEWLNNPAAYAEGPGKSSLDAVLRGLSVQGNPFGSPTNIALAGDIANRNWQNAVTGFGNLGLAGQDSRNSLLAGAAGADRGVTTALSSGLDKLTNQQDNILEGILRRLGGSGLNLGNYIP